jgi:hypothetical protein
MGRELLAEVALEVRMANTARVQDKMKRAKAAAEEELAKARAKAERKIGKIQAALAKKEGRIRAELEETVSRAEAKLKRRGRAKKTAKGNASREGRPALPVQRRVKKKR